TDGRRVDRRSHRRSREENDHRRSERGVQAGGAGRAQGYSLGQRRAAGLGRLHRQPVLERRRRAVDQRDRRYADSRVVVVRQRNGLLGALRGPHGPRGQPAVSRRTLTDLPAAAIDGQRALVREDFNVPLKDGVVTDDSRLRAALPTITYLREKGARIIILSHLGRPTGGPEPKYSLRQIVRPLETLLGSPVEFIPDPATG